MISGRIEKGIETQVDTMALDIITGVSVVEPAQAVCFKKIPSDFLASIGPIAAKEIRLKLKVNVVQLNESYTARRL